MSFAFSLSSLPVPVSPFSLLPSILILSFFSLALLVYLLTPSHPPFSDLAKFIAADRIPCTIDRVNGIIETNRPDDKNKQYADVVKHGDGLITKLQKYGQAVRLRGSERG